PLAFAIGEGAEQRAPMARAVIGGLLTSTLLTLFVVPVVYTLLDDLVHLRVRGLVRQRSGHPASPEREPVVAGGD
ncbi:MAG TPA: efflux RND transporter permease subunit, partial [Longimicrobiales bacterium]|nr:efflux RND transporter permease subunit [Longimicrobiales bacterium]